MYRVAAKHIHHTPASNTQVFINNYYDDTEYENNYECTMDQKLSILSIHSVTSVTLCIVAKRNILQQNCLSK